MKIRQEINIISTAFISTGTVNGTEIVELDTTKYSGTPTFFFEAYYSGAASNTGTIKLRRFGTTTDDASLAGATSGTAILTRSASFSPPAGATQYMVTLVGDGTRSQTVLNGRIVILQDETTITSTQTQIELSGEPGNQLNTAVTDLARGKLWKYTAANWDGTKTFSVEATWKTSASNTCTITLCRTSDNAANVTIVSALSSSAAYTRTRVTFTPVDGETYKIRALCSTTKSTYIISTAKIIVAQTASPTKLEPTMQSLTQNVTTTGIKNANASTRWTASEWDVGGGTITYFFAMDSGHASNSAQFYNINDADAITGTATGIGQIISSALTVGAGELVTGKQYTTNVLAIGDVNNQIYGTRILVVYVFVAPVVVMPELITEPMTPSRWRT